MLSILRTNLQRLSSVVTPRLMPSTPKTNFVAMYHLLSRPPIPGFASLSKTNDQLLVNSTILPKFLIQPNCGLKVKGVLRRRCKDCYFVKRQERLYVMCKSHPRHKQMSFVKKEKNTWILSHAMQSKVRPY